jgi:ADP-ribose pyrophosphatase YjhB (NUDIX family)
VPKLSEVPTRELLQEVLNRDPEGMYDGDSPYLVNEAFALADILATRVCVDGAAVRQNQRNETELMAIRRNTGPYSGRLCLVGGGVQQVKEGDAWLPESFEEALRRHFKTDLGYDIEPVTSWQEPQSLAQDMRPINGEVREGFTPNPASRHLVAARFLVRITSAADAPTYGTTAVGGQEAAGVEWFSEQDMPDAAAFGYGMRPTYELMFKAASRLLG